MPIKTIVLIGSLLMMIGVVPTLNLSKRWTFYPGLALLITLAGLAIGLTFGLIQID